MRQHHYAAPDESTANEPVELALRGPAACACIKRDRFLGRVEINQAGLAAFAGRKGSKKFGTMSWDSSSSTERGPQTNRSIPQRWSMFVSFVG